MYWFHVDETNIEPSQGTFMIHGGLVMTAEQMQQAHDLIQQIRSEYGYKPSDSFKFQTKSRPDDIEVPRWSESKNRALVGAAQLGIDMLVLVTHHESRAAGIASGRRSTH